MKVLASHFGNKTAIYLNAFMAGCSEDPAFLAEVLQPLCAKLGVAVPLGVSMIRAMQGDLDSIAAVGGVVLGTPPGKFAPPLADEDARLAIADLNASLAGEENLTEELTQVAASFATKIDGVAVMIEQVTSDDEFQAFLMLVVIVDLVVVIMTMTGAVNGDKIGVILESTAVTFLFIAEVALRFAAHVWLSLAKKDVSVMSFFSPSIVKVDCAVTVLDFFAWLAIIIMHSNSMRGLRVVKVLRLLRLLRIARVATVASDDRDMKLRRNEWVGELVKRLKIQNFRALCMLKSPATVWEGWVSERAVLCHTLFGAESAVTKEGELDLVRVAAAAGRSNVAIFDRIMVQVCGDGEDRKVARTVVDVWNRAMTAFATDASGVVPVDELDALFSSSEAVSPKGSGAPVSGGFSIFIGSVCRMATFVAEKLADVAKTSSGRVGYPPFAPRLLLAMKRDNVLESVDGKVLVKDAYLDPVENLLMALVGVDFTKQRLYAEPEEKRLK